MPEEGLTEAIRVREDGPIHEWFGLSYSSFMVLPRVLMQSMPLEWQERFVKSVEELREAYAGLDLPSEYAVTEKRGGKFSKATLPHYRRGRVEPRGRYGRQTP